MAYNPPIGIPNPASDLGYEIDVATPAWPASWLTGTTTATAGYYFIAPDDPAATNSSNPYGHPDLPRANLPHTSSFVAGDVVWMKGGTYVYATGAGLPNPGAWDIYCNASAAAPLWIIGDPDDAPTIETPVDVGGYGAADHIIIDGLYLNGFGFEVKPKVGSNRVSEILIRNCTGVGQGILVADANGVVIGGGETGLGSRDFDVENIVIYNNTFSGYGQWDYGDENDFCGVQKDYRSNKVWVLDNTIFHVGGDAVAGSPLAADPNYLSERYYIGRNTMYECGENAIDIKGVNYVTVSENIIYGPMGSQQGGGAIFHRGSGLNPVVQNVACVFNKFYHLSAGISCQGSPPATTGLVFIGNTFHEMHSSIAYQAENNLGYCIASEASAGTVYVADNSMEDYEIGVLVNGPGDFDVFMHGNIFGTRHTYTPIEGKSNVNKQWIVYNSMPVVSDYNIFQGTPDFIYDGTTRNFAYLQGDGLEAHSLSATDPLYTNAATGNLNLQSGSPAIDASIEGSDAYDAFESIFGIDIRGYDRAGNARPYGEAWDIGALEYGSGPPDPEEPGGGDGTATAASITCGTLQIGS